MLEAFQEAVRDMQRAAGNITAAYSQRVTVIAEESDIFILGLAELRAAEYP